MGFRINGFPKLENSEKPRKWVSKYQVFGLRKVKPQLENTSQGDSCLSLCFWDLRKQFMSLHEHCFLFLVSVPKNETFFHELPFWLKTTSKGAQNLRKRVGNKHGTRGVHQPTLNCQILKFDNFRF